MRFYLKPKLALLPAICVVMATGGAADQDSISLHFQPKVGQSRSYSMQMTELTEGGSADVDAVWSETVKTFDADSGADLLVAYAKYAISAGGTDIPVSTPDNDLIHLDRNGRPPLSTWLELSSPSRLVPTLFTTYISELPLRKELKADRNLEQKSSAGDLKVNSTTKLVSMDDVSIKVHVTMKFESTQFNVPLSADYDAVFDSGSSELKRMEGKITSIPDKVAGRYHVASAEFKVSRTAS